jgi:hypothetical protein
MLLVLGEGEWVVGQALPREAAQGVSSKPVVQTSNIFSIIVYKPFALIKFELVDPRLCLPAGFRAIDTSRSPKLKIFDDANS